MAVDKEKVKNKVRLWLKNNGVSAELLDNVYYQSIKERICVAVFPNIPSKGLVNDMECQAIPILFVNEDYSITKTDRFDEVINGENPNYR